MIEISVNDENVNQLLNRYKDQLGPKIRTVIARACLRIEAGAKRNAEVDVGRLRSSITHRIVEGKNDIEGRVGTNVFYAPYREKGTRPHYVPAEALRVWIRRHGLEKKLLERTGLWVHRGGRKWFVPFSASPGLEAWARAHGLAERKAIRVSGKAHPFLQPAFDAEASNVARDIKEVLQLS